MQERKAIERSTNGVGEPPAGTAGLRGAAATVPRWRFGLASKLLWLTIGFVMLAEILIFVPSIANFRLTWLTDRLSAAQLAALAAEAAPGGVMPQMLRDELLKTAQVRAIALKRGDARRLIIQDDMPPEVLGSYDLRTGIGWKEVMDAVAVFFQTKDRGIRVIGKPAFGAGDFVEIVIMEQPLKAAMTSFGLRVLGLSIVISMITAALVYVALNALLVRPINRIMRNMMRFSANPEDASRIIQPSGRVDEIGTAERELAAMQSQLSQTLQQKSRLAALGLAVSKISHDLRNILSTSQLISDRFQSSQDPIVLRLAPKLIGSLDRAIQLCADTLRYGRAEETAPRRRHFALAPLVAEVGEDLGLPRDGVVDWVVDVGPGLTIDADPDQLFRVLSNLCRNALQALDTRPSEPATTNPTTGAPAGNQSQSAGVIEVRAQRDASAVSIRISDNGPGVPQRARQHLFEAFTGAVRPGGTGLGLAIAAELIRAHGGTIMLMDRPVAMPGLPGAVFLIAIPDRPDVQ